MDGPAGDKLSNNGENYDGMFESEEEKLAGQAEAWKYTFAFVESLAVKSVVLLGIPDIIAHHGHRATLSLSQIAAELPSEKPDVNCLFRILRFLVAKNFFRADTSEGANEVRYGLTPASKWLVKDGVAAPSLSITALLLMQNDVTMMAPWHHFNDCVLDGGVAFEKANGLHVWDYAAAHPDYNGLFNQAMACNTNFVIKALLSTYGGFQGLNSLVDVGGGIGITIAEIVKAHPTINGINYDLPHVVATAPRFPGVKHVGGDMFKKVPSADAVFMKLIMHDWADEDCVKILKQCRKAIPDEGKVIIVDVVLNTQEKTGVVPSLGLVSDLVMLAHTSGGKERSEEQWENLLKEGGFPRFYVIAIPALQSVIEAFPY
ncbi:(R,S)-reticuline 7-O-methyltransferase-like [Cryptomeria japonica]|uniref:(R,S)-reticuline 7-O-methyltransferase-like n=1 Tax=Cryptomeria japonica TaxID=3369 RepID=UPI0027DA9F0C|nr:(R,S)-reticuline 7-O-methyltransferase-like [Cryptomeria japonica]